MIRYDNAMSGTLWCDMEWYDMIVFDDCKKYSVKGPTRKTGLVKSVFRDFGVERGRVRPETENYKTLVLEAWPGLCS